jgi:ubiquinone/menaquinone biosynthesis C-methylase UbiE
MTADNATHASHCLFDFSAIARDYDRWYETAAGRAHDRIQKADVVRLLRPPRPGDRLLDIGCGTGHWSRFFASLGYAVTGIDISEEMIRVARRRPAPGCVFELADACALPFDECSFEVVAAMATLEFVSDAPRVLAEMFRTVRPHGSVVVGTLNRLAPINRHRLARAREPYASGRLLSPGELRNLLGRFGRVRMVASRMPSSRRGWRLGRWIGHRIAPGRRKFAGPFIVAEVRL